jgi:hypothetical protein
MVCLGRLAAPLCLFALLALPAAAQQADSAAAPSTRNPAQQADSAAAPSAGAPAAAPARSVTAAKADVESIDAIVAAVYEAISGPPGGRDWDRLRSLFVPGARLIPAVPDSSGGAKAGVLSVEDYIKIAEAYFRENGFFEREAGHRTEAFGNIAQRWSVYESRRAAEDAQPFQRGINSFQLLKDGDRWWVVSIFWDNERPDSRIPEEYLQDGP